MPGTERSRRCAAARSGSRARRPEISASIAAQASASAARVALWLSRTSGSVACLRRVFSMAISSVSWRRRTESALRAWAAASGRGRTAHHQSEARDEAGVQPVGFGAASFGLAEGLDAARIDDPDLKSGLDQRLDDGLGVVADRLEHHASDAGLAQACDQAGDVGLGVVEAGGLPGRGKTKVEEALAGLDAGHTQRLHGIGPVCGLPTLGDARATVRSRATGRVRPCRTTARSGREPNELHPPSSL